MVQKLPSRRKNAACNVPAVAVDISMCSIPARPRVGGWYADGSVAIAGGGLQLMRKLPGD